MDVGGRFEVADWLAAGWRALRRAGPAAVQPEVLARDLGVSVAGFHAHFPDFAAFRAEMLADWAARAFGEVMAGLTVAQGPAAQLDCLVRLLVSPLRAAEDAAVRVWAREDGVVAQALTEMDARRLNAIKALCLAAGEHDPELPLLIYAASVGYAGLALPDGSEAGMRALLRLAGIS